MVCQDCIVVTRRLGWRTAISAALEEGSQTGILMTASEHRPKLITKFNTRLLQVILAAQDRAGPGVGLRACLQCLSMPSWRLGLGIYSMAVPSRYSRAWNSDFFETLFRRRRSVEDYFIFLVNSPPGVLQEPSRSVFRG